MNDVTGTGMSHLVTTLNTISSRYLADTRQLDETGLSQQRWRRRGEDTPSSVLALESTFQNWLRDSISSRAAAYVVKSSAGQLGRRYTLVPYAMILRRDVTSSPTHGVYIALLFDEHCRHLWITLNQGISQFRDRVGPSRSFEALRQGASLLAELMSAPDGFDRGPVDLAARYPYGQAYEVGAVYGLCFELERFDESRARTFAEALSNLLGLYETMPLKLARDPSLAGAVGAAADDERVFQEMVNQKSSTVPSIEIQDVIKPPPKRLMLDSRFVYQRNPSVAATALHLAGHRCEADCGTSPFVSSATGLPYVEAHHLIPLSQQEGFPDASLDVPANVVALCAGCHAKIHLAVKTAREPLLDALHAKRSERLRRSGIECSSLQLKRMYRRH